MGIGNESPAPTLRGYDRTCGARKSVAVDVMPVIDIAHLPPLFRISGSALKEPTQTLPNLPFSAISRFRRGGVSPPAPGILCGPDGSSLITVSVAVFRPAAPVGSKRITTSVDPPGLIFIGYARTSGVRKSG